MSEDQNHLQEIIFRDLKMIKCHLSRMLGERKLKISDVTRGTGIDRGTLTRLYHETASRVDLADVETLCRYLSCGVGELFELQDDDVESVSEDRADS